MAVTNNAELANKMALMRSHGITRDPTLMTHEADGPWYYQQIELGFNYRMTDIQAALGISQMQRLDNYVSKRYDIAKRYDQLLSDMPINLPLQHTDSYSALHLYVIRLQKSRIQRNQRQIFEVLRGLGIGVNLHYIPVHTQPYFQKMGFQAGDFPHAERYYTDAISLPIYATMSATQQQNVVDALNLTLADE